jgi:hypothetical protein
VLGNTACRPLEKVMVEMERESGTIRRSEERKWEEAGSFVKTAQQPAHLSMRESSDMRSGGGGRA